MIPVWVNASSLFHYTWQEKIQNRCKNWSGGFLQALYEIRKEQNEQTTSRLYHCVSASIICLGCPSISQHRVCLSTGIFISISWGFVGGGQALPGAAYVFLSDVWLNLISYLEGYMFRPWTVWWYLSAFTVVGEQRLWLWLGADKVMQSSSDVCWEHDQGPPRHIDRGSAVFV